MRKKKSTWWKCFDPSGYCKADACIPGAPGGEVFWQPGGKAG